MPISGKEMLKRYLREGLEHSLLKGLEKKDEI